MGTLLFITFAVAVTALAVSLLTAYSVNHASPKQEAVVAVPSVAVSPSPVVTASPSASVSPTKKITTPLKTVNPVVSVSPTTDK